MPRGKKVALKSSNQHIPPTFPFSLWLISHLYSTCSLVSYSFRIDWYGPERQFTAHFLLVYCGDPDLNSPPLMWGRHAVRKLESNKSQWSSMIAKCSPGGWNGAPFRLGLAQSKVGPPLNLAQWCTALRFRSASTDAFLCLFNTFL